MPLQMGWVWCVCFSLLYISTAFLLNTELVFPPFSLNKIITSQTQTVLSLLELHTNKRMVWGTYPICSLAKESCTAPNIVSLRENPMFLLIHYISSFLAFKNLAPHLFPFLNKPVCLYPIGALPPLCTQSPKYLWR